MVLSPGNKPVRKEKMRFDPKSDTLALNLLFGIRFHHFANRHGRLVATIATEPVGEGLVAVACAVCSAGDSPSRFRGRQISLGRLEVGKSVTMPLEDLKRRISDRTILAEFVPDGLAHRLGYASTGDFVADLRPRAPFVPREARGE
jgi:hypothetical protein